MERTGMRVRTDAMLIAISPEPIGRGIKMKLFLFQLSFIMDLKIDTNFVKF